MKYIFTLLLSFCFLNLIAQNPTINELDADTDGVDTKEFIEIKTDNPFSPLDGYLLVLFNGSSSGGDLSYFNLDLDGFTTDINGLFVLGASEVSPIPDFELQLNTIQNGADAVAIYQANESDMPIGTLATTTNLVDALVYGTNDADDTGLLNLLGLQQQIDESANGNKDFESIQRANDGSWFVDTPTPKQLNDGSGVILNGITISTNQEVFDEGETVIITLTTEDPVVNDITFNLDLNNGDFNNADYTGDAFIDFQTGDTTGQTQINILADGVAEEDEFMEINISNLPPEFISNNNNVSIIIIDADFTTSNFGSPLNPTFDNVASNAPSDYYDNLDGLAGNALIQGIQNLVSENSVVRTHTYTDIIDILKEADQNPDNNNQVWLVYTEQPRAKFLFQTGSSSIGKWNREHTFPRSRGGFSSIEDDDIADGINVWWETNADSLRHANSDAHGLRAADAGENSSRGNQHYGQYIGPPSNTGSFKGDVARGVFFLAIRYNDLDVVNGFPSVTGELGDLATLLNWHQQDPPDDFEMNRNNVIYNWQKNRNPFIDFPNLVDFIWGTEFGNPWNQNLSIDEKSIDDIVVFPNPVINENIQIKGLNPSETYQFKLLDISGKTIWSNSQQGNSEIPITVKSGLYFLSISDTKSTQVERIIVR
ncbi:endonuclease [Flavobacteriaceae bacterium 14752]|uniref:endonuclease n=1 Tax=Mesohalobacter salilacus TaxID=2491711 RepID=UPI000F63DFFB|nr:T9SS C-terminal target domain-containing protein [Flavobacteriaceae bacterium 14752]